MKRLIILTMLATAIILCGCIGTTQEKKSNDSKLAITPESYQTTYNGQKVFIESTTTNILADAPIEDDGQGYQTIFISFKVTHIELQDIRKTDILLELPNQWIGILRTTGEVSSSEKGYVYEIQTSHPQFLGYDVDSDNIADGYYSNPNINFDGEDYEDEGYDKIYSGLTKPGKYTVTFIAITENDENKIDYEVILI